MALAGLRATAPHSSCLAQAHQPPRCAVLAIDSRWNAASRPAGRRRAPPAAAAAGGGGSSSSCDGRKAPDPAAAAAASPAASDAAVTPAAACAVSIRLARAADLPALIQLEALTMEGASWSERQIEEELTRERATVLLAEAGAGAVGWAVGWAMPDELHVINLAVHPAHRRRGHARALLAHLIDRHRPAAEAVLLEVRASNQPAQALYASLGFERAGLRRRYYGDGEDAVLMTLNLR